MTAAIDINERQREILLSLLHRYLPGVVVWAYGSRVRFTARPNSDLDLVVFTRPEQRRIVAALNDQLAESDLPFLVDLHVWDEVPEKFHDIIREQYVVLQDAGEGGRGLWPPTPVDELVRRGLLVLVEGYRVRPTELGPVGIPFLRPRDIGSRAINTVVKAHIRPELRARVQAKLTQPFDVVLSPGGTRGLISMFQPDQPQCVLAPPSCVWRSLDREQLDPHFLFYLLKSAEFQVNLEVLKLQSARADDSVSLTDLRDSKLTIPPIRVQKAIVAVLGALDDKIGCNRRMNATLEAFTRALFRSWFIDFDPVQAKKTGREPAGLDPETAALFPSMFHETKRGQIPLGWSVGRLGDLCTLKRGYDLPTRARTAGPIPVVSSSGISGTHTETDVRGPGVVIGRYGTIGKVFFIDTDYWPLNTTFYVEDFQGNPPRFVFHVLSNIDYSQYIEKAAVPGINRNPLHGEPVVIPPLEVRHAFGRIVAPLWSQYAMNDQQSRTLCTLRDELFPKLLHGEVSVEGIERGFAALA